MEEKDTNSYISNSSEIFSFANDSSVIKAKSTNSSFYEEYSAEIEKINKKYFICNRCKSFPKIIFNYDNSLDLKCNCKKRTNLMFSGEDFINNYSYVENIENTNLDSYLNNLFCKEHNSRKFNYYCTDCKIDICEECFLERHKRHSLIFFKDKAMERLLNHLSTLIVLLISNPKTEYTSWEERKNLIKILLNEFNEAPCIKLFKSINSAKEYLENLNKEKQISEIITEKKQLFNNKNSFNSPIIKINITKQNFNDLSVLKEFNLKNLKKLILNENNINNIEPLLDCDFKELDILELERNKLNYQSLKDFEKMKIPNINYISLYINEIESIKIFDKISNFKTLRIFHVGANLFDKKEIIKNENKSYNLSFLKNLGITGNFTDETIHFTKNLILSNLEILYVSRNHLSSLDFLKNICCKNLFKLWAIENNLTDFNDILKLECKDNIQIINLEENNISKVDNLSEFISKFPGLKELNLSSNQIDLDIQRNKTIIEDIKNKYKNLKLIIENQRK